MSKKILLYTLLISIILCVGFVISHYLKSSKQTPQELQAMRKAETALLFDKIIDCAALIAISEQMNEGTLIAQSESFKLIGFALGKGQEYAVAMGQSPKTAKALYDQKIIDYFTAYAKDPENNSLRNKDRLTECKASAKLLKPEEQIKAAIEKAKKMAE